MTRFNFFSPLPFRIFLSLLFFSVFVFSCEQDSGITPVEVQSEAEALALMTPSAVEMAGDGTSRGCGCEYVIVSVETNGPASGDGFMVYNFAADNQCQSGAFCNYFSFAEENMDCTSVMNLDSGCYQRLDPGTTPPNYAGPFNCSRPRFSSFGAAVGLSAWLGTVPSNECVPFFGDLNDSKLTFKIRCWDESPVDGCTQGQGYISNSQEILFNPNGNGAGISTFETATISLGGECGCEPTISL